MIALSYVLAVCAGLLAVAFAGVATERHFIVVMLAIELIFLASTIAIVAFFSYAQNPGPDGVVALVSIWAVAAVEIITLITFYVYMKSRGFGFDISTLSRLRW